MNRYESPDYAREELRAEIGSAFTKANLNLTISPEQIQDHSNYLSHWIEVLQNDPNEFFRACQDAEKISDYLMINYNKTMEAMVETEAKLEKEEFNEPEFDEPEFNEFELDEVYLSGKACQFLEEWEKRGHLIS